MKRSGTNYLLISGVIVQDGTAFKHSPYIRNEVFMTLF